MSASHTPAPWRYEPGRDGRPPYVIRGSEGGFVVVGMSAARQEADARVIASSPVLLNTLKAVLADCMNIDNDSCLSPEVGKMVRAAIGEATGDLNANDFVRQVMATGDQP